MKSLIVSLSFLIWNGMFFICIIFLLLEKGIFQKKFETPLLRIPVRKVKVIGIPEGYPEIRGENEDFQRGYCKKVENSRGVMEKLTANPVGSTSKEIAILNRGLQFFLEKPKSRSTVNINPCLLI